jgi:excisionase family DNA binding protein
VQDSEAKPDERLAYRIDDFCHVFGIGRTKTYQLINAGILKAVVVGGRRLIPREAAEALLKHGAPDNQAA